MNDVTESKQPTHVLWLVSEGDRPRWTKIGAGWRHRDGKGLTLTADMFPLTGRIVVREINSDQSE